MIYLYRIIRNAFQNFFRHGLLTFATVSVMSLTLFSVSIIILINVITNEAIFNIQKQLDITVQLQTELTQNEIDVFRNELSNDDRIESIAYKSKQQALEEFKARFRDRVEIVSYLEKLGQNPLYASVTLVASDPTKYDQIISSLESAKNQKYVKSIKGKDDQRTRINRLLEITGIIKKVLLILTIGFSLVALLIIINTIRVTIYTRHQEIVIMKLVGATYSFITIPFLIEGLLYGVFATIISTSLFFPVIHYSSPFISQYFDSSTDTILTYYLVNLIDIISAQLIVGGSVGVVSAYLAVQHYLKENEIKAEIE